MTRHIALMFSTACAAALAQEGTRQLWNTEFLSQRPPVKHGEAPRGGYLYVIDREQYADGSSSAPYLIYPNFQNRAGDNAVAPGRLIEIPDRHAEPNHFVIRPSRGDQTGELLALLVTTEPLKN